MPITIKVPVSDSREIGGSRQAVSLSDLYIVYGNPHDFGVEGQIRKQVQYADGRNGYQVARWKTCRRTTTNPDRATRTLAKRPKNGLNVFPVR